MRKINKKLFTMILTLLLTLIAFVTSLYAWFVDNDSTDASIIGSSSNLSISNVKLQRYKFKSNTISYSLDDFTSSNLVSDYSDVDAFDLMNTYDKIFYVISFKALEDTVINISLNNIDSNKTNKIVEENGLYYNYYSNVALFSYYIVNSNKLVQSKFSSNMEMVKFEYDGDLSTISLISNYQISAQEEYSFYILADYDVEYINNLFSDNLGISCDKVCFKEDIQFLIY